MRTFAYFAGLLYAIWLAGYFIIVPTVRNHDIVLLYGEIPFILPVLLIGGLWVAIKIAERLHL